jgi:hypothetical protein
LECRFLLAVLRGSGSMLKTIKALQDSVPGIPPLPIGTDALVNLAALTDNIERQVSGHLDPPVFPRDTNDTSPGPVS